MSLRYVAALLCFGSNLSIFKLSSKYNTLRPRSRQAKQKSPEKSGDSNYKLLIEEAIDSLSSRASHFISSSETTSGGKTRKAEPPGDIKRIRRLKASFFALFRKSVSGFPLGSLKSIRHIRPMPAVLIFTTPFMLPTSLNSSFVKTFSKVWPSVSDLSIRFSFFKTSKVARAQTQQKGFPPQVLE